MGGLQVLKGLHKPPNNLNLNYGRTLQALKGRNISAQVVRPGYCRVSTIIRPARSAHLSNLVLFIVNIEQSSK